MQNAEIESKYATSTANVSSKNENISWMLNKSYEGRYEVAEDEQVNKPEQNNKEPLPEEEYLDQPIRKPTMKYMVMEEEKLKMAMMQRSASQDHQIK